MDKRESVQPSAEASEGVWPPEPWRDGPPPLSLRVEGVQLTRTGDGLTVLNKPLRRLMLAEFCLLPAPLWTPWITFWTSPFHHATWPGLLPYVLSMYGVIYPVYLVLLSMMAGFWCLFLFQFSLGVVTLERRAGTIKSGGRQVRPMKAAEAVQIVRAPSLLGVRHSVSLIWSGGDLTPRWKKALTNVRDNVCFLASFRQGANAEKVAEVISDFLGVPVRHQVKTATRAIESDL